MVTMQERRTRKVLHELRLGILERQTNIREQYCNQCPLREQSNLTTCENCPATPQLAKCGEELLEVSNIIRGERKKEVAAVAKEFGLTKATYRLMEKAGFTHEEMGEAVGLSVSSIGNFKKKNNLGRNVTVNITVEEYQQLADKGMSDAAIARYIGEDDVYRLREWKKRQGIRNKKSVRKSARYRLYINGELKAEGTVLEISQKVDLTIGTLHTYRSKKFKKWQETAERKVQLVKEGEVGW